MDTLLHTPTSMAKRPCPFTAATASTAVAMNNHQVDGLLQTFLDLADSPSLSIDLSLEHLLESSPCDSDQSVLIDRALKLGSILLEAGNRSSRKRSSKHNSLTWVLPPDLTIKVFSMLDTQSLCYAAATCSMFHKCAMDPLCYANIDLTTVVPKVNNAVVSTMIQRAGKSLQHVELRQTLVSVSMNCPLIERLFFESSKTGRDESLKSPTCVDLVTNCPNLTSLALRGFKLHDCKVRILVKGFRKLKYVDFSTSYSITGHFLRNLGGSSGGNLLEVLILRDCMHLKEVEVARLLTAVLTGDFKSLRHLDVSNREGLASESDWYHRCYSLRTIPVKQVLEARPDMCLLADFPPDGSFIDVEQMIDSELNSEVSLPSQLSSHTSDSSLFMSTSESSYNSDQSSGNEESRDSAYIVYEESSDEVDFLGV
ncbi:F-box protein At4g02760 isoform X2 [Ricinus communis]|uniref:F-box protein At4g02760 isoform X2 n=1 Tax=Ricinus communis TaxID=3988 RepID=UPI00201AA95C|nr:F-box protein At4g02760 isoform X2 [Ricinus communis]